jgi:large subunit ribosomal protein L9
VEVTIPVRIGEGGKLFGSVTGKDVSEALKKQNIDIDKKKISIKDTITGTGVYEAVIKVHPAITSTVKVNIVAE